MTDEQIIKTSGEVSSEKIKAIYPHIVVSGDIDKPYYSIQYYDIEKKTMFDCYASYKLGLVRKWLEQYFEFAELDISDLINRLQADKEALIAGQETLQKALAEKNAKIEALQMDNAQLQSDNANANMNCEHLQAEIERLKDAILTIEECLEIMDFDETAIYCMQNDPEMTACIKANIKAEAIKEFAEGLCEGRVSNDPVVIAVKVELKKVGDAE